MQTQTAKRNATIDMMKGLAILFLVFNHVVQRNLPHSNWFMSTIMAGAFTTFIMPLFIFISGYLCAASDRTRKFWLFGKTSFFLYLFTLWTAIYYFVAGFPFAGVKSFINTSGTLGDFLTRTFVYPETTLWYLYILIECYILMRFSDFLLRFMKRWQSLLLIFVLVNLVPATTFGLIALKWYLLFFFLGVFAFEKKDILLQYFKQKSFLLESVFFGLSVYLYLALSLQPGYFLSDFFTSPLNYLLRVMVALLGILLSYKLCKRLKTNIPTSRVLTLLGLNSLGVYVSHFIFLRLGLGVGIIKILSTYILCFMAVSASLFVIKKTFLRRILLLDVSNKEEKRRNIFAEAFTKLFTSPAKTNDI